MTPEEINRRVALALGWRTVVMPYNQLLAHRLIAWIPASRFAVESAWFQGAEEIPANADHQGLTEALGYECPRFCTDPAAADLVRLEIERRGWEISLSMVPCTEGPSWYAEIDVEPFAEPPGPSVSGPTEGIRNPHHALCLAFLAATEQS